MTARTPEELLKLYQNISTVLNWHIRARGTVGGVRLCSECRQPYPCRTRLMLMGRINEATGSMPIKYR